MFNTEYFLAWMKKLLNALAARGLSNTLIVMDNAKYHKTLPSDTPSKGWKKSRLQEACQHFNIAFDSKETKPELWAKLEPVIALIKPIVVRMAEDAGHEVLFSPPHYSDL